MLTSIVRLQQEMGERFTRSADLDGNLGFLLDTEQVMYGEPSSLRGKCLDFAQNTEATGSVPLTFAPAGNAIRHGNP